MAWTQELKDKMKEIAQKKRGVLLKDIPADMLMVLTDEVKIQGLGVATPTPHTGECVEEHVGRRGGRRWKRNCDHPKACYLKYASREQVEAIQKHLPSVVHTTNQYIRATGLLSEVEKVVFNLDDIEYLLKLAHVGKPEKYIAGI